MKALKITNAPLSFGQFLMAMNIPFRFSYGDFIIENTSMATKFYIFCEKNGVPTSQLSQMVMTVVKIDTTVTE